VNATRPVPEAAIDSTDVSTTEPAAVHAFAAEVAAAVEPNDAERSRLAVALEKTLAKAANLAWPALAKWNEAFPGARPQPKWAPAPLLRAKDKSAPPLGFPRQTDSLCPKCVKEVRTAVLSGEQDLSVYVDGKPGEIKASIIERDGQILMVKECPVHGRFEDLMAIDPAFLRRIEGLFPGRDYLAPLTKLRDHGSSSVKWGRGAVLTVDLTNRCNMMCDPCFMDANQVGYVHELSWAEIKQILDDAVSIKPKRQMSIQFSGGEPTLSPYFLDAIRYAREVGYFAVQCATNGIAFAQDPEFAKQAKAAGLRMAYLQFDGVTNEANGHRKVGNLFDVKLRAIENLHAAGIDVILVVTIVNGVNNDQVGPIVDFAIENADKITVVSFQPVSFTGRDEDVTDERRHAQRYTLSHLAWDLKHQLGSIEPHRDWFPLSSMAPFADLTDVMLGEGAEFGSVNCGCHPNCGVGTILFVNKKTKEMVPLTRFLDLEQLMRDVQSIADGAQGRAIAVAELLVALLRNFKPDQAPPGYGFVDLVKQFTSQIGARGKKVGEFESDANEFEWRVLFVAGMWFQDLFNYDFRRTEMCIIPYGTQMGEISFCAYNTGVGWRQIIEQMKANASVAEWYRTKGRHPVYAKGQDLPLPASLGTVRLPASAVALEEASRKRRRLTIVR
jgi:uncharacterized radical SAM superfamily Fe-S cluster-containing enzyme